jgi:hypothetical protein
LVKEDSRGVFVSCLFLEFPGTSGTLTQARDGIHGGLVSLVFSLRLAHRQHAPVAQLDRATVFGSIKLIQIALVENHENRRKTGVFEHFSLLTEGIKSARKVSFRGVMTPGFPPNAPIIHNSE